MADPVISPGWEGAAFRVIASEEDGPSPQELEPLTEILSEMEVFPYKTVIVLVVLAPLAPAGNVQTYEVAFGIT